MAIANVCENAQSPGIDRAPENLPPIIKEYRKQQLLSFEPKSNFAPPARVVLELLGNPNVHAYNRHEPRIRAAIEGMRARDALVIASFVEMMSIDNRKSVSDNVRNFEPSSPGTKANRRPGHWRLKFDIELQRRALSTTFLNLRMA